MSKQATQLALVDLRNKLENLQLFVKPRWQQRGLQQRLQRSLNTNEGGEASSKQAVNRKWNIFIGKSQLVRASHMRCTKNNKAASVAQRTIKLHPYKAASRPRKDIVCIQEWICCGVCFRLRRKESS
eukprot:1084152-Pleurochrysis_carterae.AAC.3